MALQSGSGDRAHAPVPLRAASDPLRIVPAALSQGALALIVRAYGEVSILINEAVPALARRAVAAHAAEQHSVGCYSITCKVAQEWLGHAVRRSPPITAASA